ncbi:unnamed protein product, partial [Strongylus vulgaris]
KGIVFKVLSFARRSDEKQNVVCTDDTGTWTFAIAEGVTDFAHGGVPLNKSFNCFEGCLATGTAVQNFKVRFFSSITQQNFKKIICLLATLTNHENFEMQKPCSLVILGYSDDGDDPNADSCIDPVLRDDIQNALNKVTDHSCKDMNFCAYIGVVSPYLYDIRMGKIDMS